MFSTDKAGLWNRLSWGRGELQSSRMPAARSDGADEFSTSKIFAISPVNPSLTKLQLLAVFVAIKYLGEPSGMQPAPPEKRVKCLKLLHFGFHRAKASPPW